MIIGSCPYKGCEGRVWEACAPGDKCPCYQRHKCEECKRWIWTKHSRVDPCSWTERNFLKEYKVDKKTKQIELRNPPKPLTKKQKIIQAMMNEVMRKAITEHMIYGTGVSFGGETSKVAYDLLNRIKSANSPKL